MALSLVQLQEAGKKCQVANFDDFLGLEALFLKENAEKEVRFFLVLVV